MREYQILNKGFFESNSKFEKKLNLKALEGWKVVNIAVNGSGILVALLEKEREY